ncbi:uncharacterized protein LOC144151431 [Haemaphysalis longicornis]
MESTRKLFVVSVAFLYLSLPSDGGWGPHKLQREVPDAFKTFAEFPFAIGIADNDNDTIFECLTARRHNFDPVAKTVTYDWSLNTGPGQERYILSLHHTAGDTPDAAPFTVNDGDTVYDGYVVYTDYKDCAVTEVPFWNNEQCTLWVSEALKDLVPTHCLRQFHDICGVAVPLRDSDLCPDD